MAHFGEKTGFRGLVFVLIVLTDPLALLVDLVISIGHLIFDEARGGLIHLLEFAVTIAVVPVVGLVRDGHEQLLLFLVQMRVVRNVDVVV